MFQCPSDPETGSPHCYITSHPDRPHEYFCATCKRKLHVEGEDENLSVMGVLILAIVAIVLVL